MCLSFNRVAIIRDEAIARLSMAIYVASHDGRTKKHLCVGRDSLLVNKNRTESPVIEALDDRR